LWDVAEPRSIIRQQSILYEAEAFIEENLGRQFSVEEVCMAASTEHGGMLRAFRSEHGVSIQQFIVQKRLQEACRLLTATDLPIKEVAVRTGYVDLQQFNKMLRRHVGKSPSLVRAEHSPNREKFVG
jgi:transcriptional regulator GlxA family with amidase domain